MVQDTHSRTYAISSYAFRVETLLALPIMQLGFGCRQRRLAELEQRLDHAPDEEAKTILAQRLSNAAVLEERVRPAPDPQQRSAVERCDFQEEAVSREDTDKASCITRLE